jgi:hypothetical protein
MRGWSAHNAGELQGFYDELEAIRAQSRDSPLFVCYHLMCWDSPYDMWAEFVNTMEAGGDVVAVTVAQFTSLIQRSSTGEVTTTAIVLAIAGIWGIPFLVHAAAGAGRKKKGTRSGGASP